MSKKRKRATTRSNHAQIAKKSRKDGTCYTSSSLDGSLQHAVLSTYFPRVVTLREFLHSELPVSRQKRLLKTDLTVDKRNEWNTFLDETLLGIAKETGSNVEKTRHQEFLAFTQDPQRLSNRSGGSTPEQQIEEVVEFVVWSLFHKQSSGSLRPNHILCRGYQRVISQKRVPGTAIVAPKIQGLVVKQPNQSVNALKEAPWTTMLASLGKDGDRIVRDLLLDTAVFLRLSNGKDNYYQLSGVPLSDLPQKTCDAPISRPAFAKTSTASNILLTSHQMLYAKPCLNSKEGVRFGMPRNHVLNCYSSPADVVQTVHVMKYVFPRQFGLLNIFASARPLQSKRGLKNYTLRESEINSEVKRVRKRDNNFKTTKLPRRLRGAAQLLIRKMQRNHKHCPYDQLLRYYTSEVTLFEPGTNDTAPTQPTGSVTKTQITASSSSSSVTTCRSVRVAAQAFRGSIMHYATSIARVSAFCQAVLRHLLPGDTFGSGPEGEANWSLLTLWMNRFLAMGRNETLNLHVIVQCIKIRAVSWLKPPKLANLKMSTSDHAKRWEIFNDFVYYIFDSLLVPLIRSNFYVTQSAVHRHQLFYFRHDVWRKVSVPSLAHIKLTMFDEVASGVTHGLGHSTIRLVPKLNGTRIIANLKKQVMRTFRGRSVPTVAINKQLEPVFDVLKYEQSRQPLKLGSAIFSPSDIHGPLKAFRNRVSGQKLYFVKLDIKSCFDSIPQEEIVTLAEMLFQDTQYRIRSHTQIKSGDEKISQRFLRTATACEDVLDFSAGIACDLASNRKRTVFIDTGKPKVLQTQPLLNMLQKHITSNTVKIGKKLYRQKNGIPQGSILSSLLCSFFYGAFEIEQLSFLDERSFLIRLIDDFLLITTEPSHARRFLDIMSCGNPKYGITIQASKSLTNFEASVNGRKIPRLHGTTAFPYIGWTIDTLKLSIAKERTSKDPKVRNGVTVKVGTAGRAFHAMVLHSLKIQLLGAVLDTNNMNSKIEVLTNLYQCFAEMAMKMCRYIDGMIAKPSAGLVISVIEASIALAFNLMRRPSRARENLDYQCDISRLQTQWVASVAVDAVLRRKQSRYGEVLKWCAGLKRKTEVGIRIDRKMQEIIMQEGSRGFRSYVF